MTLTFVLRSY